MTTAQVTIVDVMERSLREDRRVLRQLRQHLAEEKPSTTQSSRLIDAIDLRLRDISKYNLG